MNRWTRVLLLIVALAVMPHLTAGQKTEPTKKSQPRTDVYGDPLPKGAVARLGTVRYRHNWYVEAIAFSPDGKVVVSGDTHAARMWAVASGKELRRFEDYSASHQALAFTPDGKMLAGGGRHCVILWNPSTGRELRRFKVKGFTVTALALSPDGRQLAATGIGDKAVRLWDVATGKEVRRFADQKGYSYCLTFSPDGAILASASQHGTVHFWEVASGKARVLFRQDPVSSRCVAFSPDGKLVAATGILPDAMGRNHCAVHLWDLATGKKLPQFGMDKRLGYRLAFAPDGKTLGVAGNDGMLRLWDVATGKLVRQPDAWPRGGGSGYFRTLAFSPDGKIVAGPSLHTSVLSLWSTATGKQLNAFAAHDAPVQDIVASPDGKTIASRGDYDNGMHLWETDTGKHLRTLRHQGSGISKLAFTPDSRTAITSDAWGDDLRVWQAATGKEMRRIKVRGARYCVSLAVSPDGKILAGGTSRGEVFLWELSAGKQLLRFVAHPPKLDEGRIDEYVPVSMLLFSPDGKTILSAAHALDSSLWSVATGAKVRSFRAKGRPRPMQGASLAFSPDGKTLRALQAGYKSVAWEVASGKERREFRTPYIHPGWPGCAAFSPDGQTYAVCTGNSALVQACNLQCEAETARFEGHLQPVTALTFLPDGRLASASHDTTILIWEKPPLKKAKTVSPPKLSAKQLTALWTALADVDAAKAYQAMQTLAASSRQAVMFLQKKLSLVAPVSPKRLAKLIADLDSARFAVREKAARELDKLGPLAESALKKTQANSPSLEVQLRVELLLDKLVPLVFSREDLRVWRALEVLEHVGTPEARQVFQGIAKSAEGHHFTEEAKEALKRLGR